MRVRSWATGVLALVVAMQQGCSYLFVSGPPKDHETKVYVDCTDSNGWPIVDSIWAGLNGLGAAAAIGDSETENRGQVILVGLVWLAVSGGAAIYGFDRVSQCKSAKAKGMERLAGQGAAPAAGAPVAPAAAPAAPAAAPVAPVAPAAPAAAPVAPVAPSAAPAAAPKTTPAAGGGGASASTGRRQVLGLKMRPAAI